MWQPDNRPFDYRYPCGETRYDTGSHAYPGPFSLLWFRKEHERRHNGYSDTAAEWEQLASETLEWFRQHAPSANAHR